MRIGLDTSVVLRLLTGQPPEQADLARRTVATTSAPVIISDLVVAETYFALRHHYAVPHAEAIKALAALLNDPQFRPSGHARTVLRDPATSLLTRTSAGLTDRLIHADYQSESVATATFDKALGKLPDTLLMK